VNSGRLTTRLLGTRALRLQPDGRLVALVRDGYESAFEEIFRRYGAALRSYAASIVTIQRADDVTQEAFTKAYLALKGTEKEIHLRPWLYRIVRNTALTDIRDEPRPAVELDQARASGMSPDELAEQSEEIGRLIDGLRELPEAQRAAIVMRELEGLSHKQIATSLGLSGGAVRQSIYRARRALREGLGLLVPMPLLRLLLEEGFTQGASAAAAGGGAGIAVKAGVAALLAAGTVTTGAVLNQELKSPPKADANPAKTKASASTADGADGSPADGSDSSGSSSRGPGSGGAAEHGQRGSDDGTSGHRGSNSAPGSENSGSESGHSGTGESHSGSGGGDGGEEHSGSGDSGSGGSGSSGSGSAGSGSSGSGSLSSGPGPELEPEDPSGSSGHGGSDDPPELDDD
jgi:RNA polymerase sigma factor (sigma-70 family)